jgi:hypothetical protein
VRTGNGVVDSTVVVRRTPRQLLVNVLLPALIWPAYLWFLVVISRPDAWLVAVGLLCIPFFVGIALFRWRHDERIELRIESLLSVDGLRRDRVIPWSEIESMAEARVLGVRYVTLMTTAKGFIRLYAPYHWNRVAPDPRFDEKAGMLRAWWVAYRGPGFDAPPPPF